MKDGAVVEAGPTDTVMDNPTSDYTRALLDAAPTLPENAIDSLTI
jgi:peptide/nickel transport system ATP-binding protein